MEIFNFRLVKCANGVEVIDKTLSTPYSLLTPTEMLDYTQVDNDLFVMERLKKKEASKNNTLLHNIKAKIKNKI